MLVHEMSDEKETECASQGLNSESTLQLALQQFCASQDPLASLLMLKVLYNIHKRIDNEPNVDKYYRIYIRGTVFEKYVWSLQGSEKFLLTSGWVKCGNYILLSKGYPIKNNLKIIEHTLRQQKNVETADGGDRKTSLHRTRSNIGDTTIREDELVASFTNIDTNVDGRIDDGEEPALRKNKLRRVESREHLLGDEEYVVVDFIGNLEVSSRKSSRTDAPTNLEIPSPTDASIQDSTFDEISAEKCPDFDESLKTESETNRDTDSIPDEATVEVKTYSDLDDFHKKVEPEDTFTVEKDEKVQDDDEKNDQTDKTQEQSDHTSNDETDRTEQSDKEEILPSSILNDDAKNMDEALSRTSSRKSICEKPVRPNSVVMQNKMLFDQQIAGQLKRKPSTESRTSKRSSQIDIPSNEKQANENSLDSKRNDSYRSLNELPVSGTVAGARSMFESGNIKQPTPTYSRKSTQPSRSNSNSTVENLLLQNYKGDQEVQISPKKKRFPFKKKKRDTTESPTKLNIVSEKNKKQSKTSDPELLAVHKKDEFEESPVVVPEENMDPDNEGSEKKKKGIFARMKRNSRKGSDSSDGEHRIENSHHLLERTPSSPKIKSGDTVTSNDEKHAKNVINAQELPLAPQEIGEEPTDLSLNIQTSRSNTDTSLLTPDIPPPSPGYASSEIKSVLENIIDRKSSFHNENSTDFTPKKKRLGLKLKKKSSSKKAKDALSKEVDVVKNKELQSNAVDDKAVVVDAIAERSTDEKCNIEKDVDPMSIESSNIGVAVNYNVDDVKVELNSNVKTDTSNTTVDANNLNPRPLVDEDLSTQVIKTNEVISDWPTDAITEFPKDQVLHNPVKMSVNENIPPNMYGNDINNGVELSEAIENDTAEANTNSKEDNVNPLIEDLTIETAQPIKITLTSTSEDNLNGKELYDGTDDKQNVENDDLVEMLNDASPPASPTSDSPPFDDNASVVTDASSISPGKKKKKIHFHFPRRKNSKKDKKEKEQEEIWEEAPEKRSSKKLKRPKSLDFLAEKIHPHSKKSETSNRPVTMSPGDFDKLKKGSEQKSPKVHKKRTLNLFKKKKKHTDPIETPADSTQLEVKLENNGIPPSPMTPSPDPFTIPEVNSSMHVGNGKSVENTEVTVNAEATV